MSTQAVDSAAAAAAAGRGAGAEPAQPGPPADARTPRPPAHPDDTAEIPLDGDGPRHRGVFVVLVLAALAVLGVVAYAGYSLMGNNRDQAPTTVSVPYVIGQTEAKAKSILDEQGLHPVVKHKANSAAEGQVVDQNPTVNTERPKGSDVTIVVSTGPDSVTIPDLRGQSESYAKSVLNALNLKTKSTPTDHDPNMAKGKVVSTDPGAGPVPATSTVLLRVATGKVTVPSVVGKSEQEARSILAALQLTPDVSYQTDGDFDPDEVMRQNHEGKRVKVGTEVKLVVAKAPPATATVTVTQSPTTTSPKPSTTTTSPSPTSTTTSPSPTSTSPSSTTTTPPAKGGDGGRAGGAGGNDQ